MNVFSDLLFMAMSVGLLHAAQLMAATTTSVQAWYRRRLVFAMPKHKSNMGNKASMGAAMVMLYCCAVPELVFLDAATAMVVNVLPFFCIFLL